MIYLITGVPGASKTLNAIKFISEDSTFKDRPVYYHNVRELTLPWTKLDSDEEAKSWMDLPDGSVVLFDECQGIFPQRGPKKDVPDYISELNTHRHRGFDFVIVTQHPRLIDVAVRRLVGAHYHFERAFGFNRARRLHWQECQDDPKDYHARQQAVNKSVKFDKKYFGAYKSAEVHTHKPKIPPKLIMLGLLMLVVIAGGIHFFTRLTDRFESVEPETAAATIGEVVTGKPAKQEHSFQPVYPLDPQEYLDVFKPRIEGLAHTAPVYDELTKPQRAPKTICIRVHRSSSSECNCFTEQGTRLSVPLNRCSNIVDNGLYDPTIPPQEYSSRGERTSYYGNGFHRSDLEVTTSERTLSERIQPTDLPRLKAEW